MILECLNLLADDPFAIIYALLGCTYTVAAILARREGHAALAACYTASAFLYEGLFAFELLAIT